MAGMERFYKNGGKNGGTVFGRPDIGGFAVSILYVLYITFIVHIV